MRPVFIRSLQALLSISAIAVLTGANDPGCVNPDESSGTGNVDDPPAAQIECPDGTDPVWVCGAEPRPMKPPQPCEGDDCPPPPPACGDAPIACEGDDCPPPPPPGDCEEPPPPPGDCEEPPPPPGDCAGEEPPPAPSGNIGQPPPPPPEEGEQKPVPPSCEGEECPPPPPPKCGPPPQCAWQCVPSASPCPTGFHAEKQCDTPIAPPQGSPDPDEPPPPPSCTSVCVVDGVPLE